MTPNSSKPTYILTDIEGTTTPITFVHQVLFPYSRERLAAFVETHRDNPEVVSALEEARATLVAEGAHDTSAQAVLQNLLLWIGNDRKHRALKTLQGLIWREGYEKRHYVSDLYPDVKPALETWKEQGLRLGVYSSGSKAAQKLLFGYSNVGDLTHLFSDYFDTSVGGKKEVGSYAAIAEALHLSPEVVLFLSDVTDELDAAKKAGFKTVQLLRPGTKAGAGHLTAKDFADVSRLFQLQMVSDPQRG